MPNRIDYRFRAIVSADSLDGDLVRYLRSKNSEFSEKDMVLWATAAYWLPLALKEQGNCSASELKQSARTSIYKLRQHINYLAQTFGLEGEVWGIPISSPDAFGAGLGGQPLTTQTIHPHQQITPRGLDTCVQETLSPLIQANSSCSKSVGSTVIELSSTVASNQFTLLPEADPEIASNDSFMPSLLHHQDDETFQTLFGS